MFVEWNNWTKASCFKTFYLFLRQYVLDKICNNHLLSFLLKGMESKESRIVATSLSIVEFLLSHRMFDESYGDQLLNFFEKQVSLYALLGE